MPTISLMNQITNYLQEHDQSTRIKKLIFCACRKKWENDQNVLDGLKLETLIEELQRGNPTIDHLKSTLAKVVKSLNKQSEYAVIANVIFHQLKELYKLQIDAATELVFKQQKESDDLLTAIPTVANFHQSDVSSNITVDPPIKKEEKNDLFDVRQDLMKYTNPLRAKIIFFSTLYYKFTFQEGDWLKLRTYQLNDLITEIFDRFATYKELDSKLNIAASCLEPSGEYMQAAGAILQCLRGNYSDDNSYN